MMSRTASRYEELNMLQRLRERKEWQFFRVLPKADATLASLWWLSVILRGVLPAVFAIAMGILVGAVQKGGSLAAPLVIVGIAFALQQVLPPFSQAVGANLGDRTAAWLYDRLTEACIRPAGMGHLEDSKLTGDLTVAREFDAGMTGPPLSVSLDFIAGGLVQTLMGFACALVLAAYAWWAALLLIAAWLSTHWMLRESAIWRDRNTEEVRAAQRDADYAYRMAVEAAPAKELRLFGLAGWTIDRFVSRRTLLHKLQYEATRLREKPVLWCMLVLTAANVLVFWSLAAATGSGGIDLAHAVIFAQSAAGVSMIAFGGLNWALDGSAAPVTAVLRLESAMAPAGALRVGSRSAQGLPAREIRFRDVTFAYPGGSPVLEHFDLTIPAGSSLAIVGQNGAGKTTLAKLLCRLYDPQSGAIEVDGVDIRELSIETWRKRLTSVFQDFIRFELPLRDNVDPSGIDLSRRGTTTAATTTTPDGAPEGAAGATPDARSARDEVIRSALESAGAAKLATLDTVLARGYDGGTDLSGGQWQRVALARALCAVGTGAGVVLLDEPTAQLDVRGEAEIFDRILTATRRCTTILISHRFSTVRHADRICVLENGRVIELGSHEELMVQGGRYRTMFDLQAQRFNATEDEEGAKYDVLA